MQVQAVTGATICALPLHDDEVYFYHNYNLPAV